MSERGIKPKMIHIRRSSVTEYLCGEEHKTWAEAYMGDEFARTLPVCDECANISTKKENKKPNIFEGLK